MSGRPPSRGRGGGNDRGRGDGRGRGRGGFEGDGRGRGRGGFEGSFRGQGPQQRGGYQGHEGDNRRPPGPRPPDQYGGGRGEGQKYYGDGGAEPGPDGKLISTFDSNRRPPKGTKVAHNQTGGTGQAQPDIKAIENQYQQQVSQDLTRLNLTDSRPYRPNYGSAGRPVTVYANFFVIQTPQNLILSHYSISLPAGLAKQSAKRQDVVLAALKKLPAFESWKVVAGTDFAQRLVVLGRVAQIDNAPTETSTDGKPQPTLSVTVPNMREDGTTSGDPHQIKFSLVSTHQVKDIIDYLSSPTGPRTPSTENLEILQAFNILLGQHARLSGDIFIKSNGSRNKLWHVKTERQDIGRGLQALKGFITSVRYATGRILLNVNNAAIAGYKPCKLLDSVNNFKSGKDYPGADRFMKGVKIHRTWLARPGDKKKKEKTIWGFASITDGYGPNRKPAMENGKPYVVVARNFAGPHEVKFLLNGNHITVYEYFKKTYPNFPIKFPNEPVVNLGTKAKPSYAPIELCEIFDGQDYRQKLDGSQTDAMLKFAVNQPWFNFGYIQQRAPPVLGLGSKDNLFSVSGITINPNFIRIDARILAPPTVRYNNNKTAKVQDGGWNMGDSKVIKAATAPAGWKFLCFIPTNDQRGHVLDDNRGALAKEFVGAFSAELRKIGLRMSGDPTVLPERLNFASSQVDFDRALQNIFERYRAEQFLFIALAEKIPDWQYKRIKVFGDIKYGITTVCIDAKKAHGEWKKGGFAFSQYAANVGLKVNLKLGGDNQGLDTSKLGMIATGRTMLVGLDVTHPAPGAPETAESVAAMVANVDGQLGQWPAQLELNGRRREEVVVIGKMLVSRIELWKRHNKNPPQYIMLFRDGVSEGQFQMVIQKELPLIKAAIKQTYPNPKMQPSVFIAVCGKRHQVRFAPSQQLDCDSGGNCNAGLVVDRGITETRVWDFYLQPHKAIQGTARSCHYTVLHDEIFCTPSGLKDFGRGPGVSKADVLQEFCNALAYTYPRATKAVSLSTPAKLADLACDRARAYVSDFIDSFGDSGSVASGSGASGYATQAQADAIKVHNNIKNTMFYI